MPEIVEIPVLWLQGASCSGCIVSLLNSFSPKASSLVLRELTPGKHVSLRFIATVMAGQGQQVVDILHDDTAAAGGYVLVVEGSLPLGGDLFATLGESDGREVPIAETVGRLARKAMCVVAMGTCSAFGGIPAGEGNLTQAGSLEKLLQRDGIDVPLVNIPGCPPHPDWLVGSLVAVMRYGLDAVAATLDELKRPKMFFGKQIHETCPRRADFDAGRFAKNFGEPGCLYELGCKGPVTYADCPTRMWNSGTNWCIGAGSPCHGCVEPGFPDRLAPLYCKIDEQRLNRFRLLEPTVSETQK
ncbi:MAG: hydrogenase small subunit [Planctomycetota bacterium]|nr:hydrogenase small subunit [Planctomycetota bacterium]